VLVTVIVRQFIPNLRKALRTGIAVSMGGEFGFALLTLLLSGTSVDASFVQALLTAVALSMLLGPLLVRYNVRIADRILRREPTTPTGIALETAATREIARREHVIICGFGRVGQNLARVLERRGLEYIAIDLDSFRVRDARQAGDPVVFGDATQEVVLRSLGLDQASVVVVSFADIDTALRIVRSVRRLRTEVPVLVRTEDDSKLAALQAAGATEVVPEIFETSLSLVSHVLLFLSVPAEEVLATTEEIRHERYAILRSVFRRRAARAMDETHSHRQQLHTVVLPPGAHAIDQTIAQLGLDHGVVVVSAIRREGITGRDPDPSTLLRVGDVLVLWGTPEDVEQVEGRLLTG
jgi:CPA2 family monovalent cation:H+ antiporter-2